MDKSAPSKESLERAHRFFNETLSGENGGKHIRDILALEFDAIARERDKVTEKLKRELEKAEGQLDIILRECQGDKSAPSKESLERARWFVMLYGNDGTPIPMMRDEDNVALFDSEGEASKCALANPLGELYGYETFEWILS